MRVPTSGVPPNVSLSSDYLVVLERTVGGGGVKAVRKDRLSHLMENMGGGKSGEEGPLYPTSWRTVGGGVKAARKDLLSHLLENGGGGG